ncbi:MAG TPA: TIM barrel protein [Candidatus Baltobacteraceae bacterium]
MKIASSSASFDDRLRSGGLTQLEWLDICAKEFELDGVVLDARHFPRIDDEYVAQLKKLATDLGLSVAAVAADIVLAHGDGAWLEIAARLGAPLLIARAPAADADVSAWNALAARARAVAAQAKALNVTIAVRNAPQSLCATSADLKRLAKDVDSAWIRFALDVAKLAPNESIEGVFTRTVAACHDVESLSSGDERKGVLDVAAHLCGFRGFLVLDSIAQDAAPDQLGQAVRTARALLARAALDAAPLT